MIKKTRKQIQLRVIILTRDRPLFLRSAIQSVIDQIEPPTEIIVSDNSTSDETQILIDNDYPYLRYVRQSGQLKAEEHMIAASRLIISGYYNFLHDDDRLSENYISEIKNIILENQDVSAVGTNFNLNYKVNPQHKTQPIFRSSDVTRVSKWEEFILGYTSPIYGGMPPFSSYTYNSSKVNWDGIKAYKNTRYYDALFLASLLERGEIVILNKKLFNLGVHDNRISNICGVRDYKIFVKTASLITKNPKLLAALEVYRIRSLISKLASNRIRWAYKRRYLRAFLCCGLLVLHNAEFRKLVALNVRIRILKMRFKGEPVEV